MYIDIHIHIVQKLSRTHLIAKTSTGEMETYIHKCLGAIVQFQAHGVCTPFSYCSEPTVDIIGKDRKNAR
jgi:hypothetical protein